MDVNTDLLAVSLDFDLGNACRGELLLQITAEVVVLNQCIAEVLLISEPTGIPIFDDTYT